MYKCGHRCSAVMYVEMETIHTIRIHREILRTVGLQALYSVYPMQSRLHLVNISEILVKLACKVVKRKTLMCTCGVHWLG